MKGGRQAHPFFAPALPAGFAVSLGLAFIVPLVSYFRPAPLGDFYSEWASAVLFCVAALFAWRFLPQRQRVDATLFLAPLVLLGLIIVQLLLGRYKYNTDWVLWTLYLLMTVFAFVVAQGVRAAGLEVETVSRLAWSVIIISLVSAFAQAVQLAHAEDQFAPYILPLWQRSLCRPYGNIAQANHTTTVAWIAIAATIYLYSVGRLGRIVCAILLGVFLLSTALTASRLAWIFVGLSSVAVVSFRGLPLPRARSRVLLAAALVAGFVAATTFSRPLLLSLSENCTDSVERLTGNSEGNYAIRFDLWRQAMLAWREAPIVGNGAASFMGTAYRVEHTGEQHPIDTFAHNSALQLLAEFGLIGAGVVAGLVIIWTGSLYRRRGELQAVDWPLIVWLGMLAAHSLLEFPLWYMYYLLFFAFSLGLLFAPGRVGPVISMHSRAVVVAFAVFGLATAAFVMRDYRALERTQFLGQMVYTVDDERKIRAMDELVTESQKDVHIYGLYTDYFLFRNMPMTRDGLTEKIEANAKLLSRAPLADVISRQVMLLTLAGDLPAARQHVQRLLTFYPWKKDDDIEQMRRLISLRPDDFGALAPILDEEVARAPEQRW